MARNRQKSKSGGQIKTDKLILKRGEAENKAEKPGMSRNGPVCKSYYSADEEKCELVNR